VLIDGGTEREVSDRVRSLERLVGIVADISEICVEVTSEIELDLLINREVWASELLDVWLNDDWDRGTVDIELGWKPTKLLELESAVGIELGCELTTILGLEITVDIEFSRELTILPEAEIAVDIEFDCELMTLLDLEVGVDIELSWELETASEAETAVLAVWETLIPDSVCVRATVWLGTELVIPDCETPMVVSGEIDGERVFSDVLYMVDKGDVVYLFNSAEEIIPDTVATGVLVGADICDDTTVIVRVLPESYVEACCEPEFRAVSLWETVENGAKLPEEDIAEFVIELVPLMAVVGWDVWATDEIRELSMTAEEEVVEINTVLPDVVTVNLPVAWDDGAEGPWAIEDGETVEAISSVEDDAVLKEVICLVEDSDTSVLRIDEEMDDEDMLAVLDEANVERADELTLETIVLTSEAVTPVLSARSDEETELEVREEETRVDCRLVLVVIEEITDPEASEDEPWDVGRTLPVCLEEVIAWRAVLETMLELEDWEIVLVIRGPLDARVCAVDTLSWFVADKINTCEFVLRTLCCTLEVFNAELLSWVDSWLGIIEVDTRTVCLALFGCAAELLAWIPNVDAGTPFDDIFSLFWLVCCGTIVSALEPLVSLNTDGRTSTVDSPERILETACCPLSVCIEELLAWLTGREDETPVDTREAEVSWVTEADWEPWRVVCEEVPPETLEEVAVDEGPCDWDIMVAPGEVSCVDGVAVCEIVEIMDRCDIVRPRSGTDSDDGEFELRLEIDIVIGIPILLSLWDFNTSLLVVCRIFVWVDMTAIALLLRVDNEFCDVAGLEVTTRDVEVLPITIDDTRLLTENDGELLGIAELDDLKLLGREVLPERIVVVSIEREDDPADSADDGIQELVLCELTAWVELDSPARDIVFILSFVWESAGCVERVVPTFEPVALCVERTLLVLLFSLDVVIDLEDVSLLMNESWLLDGSKDKVVAGAEGDITVWVFWELPVVETEISLEPLVESGDCETTPLI
jgi:hypothetical protein